jgi:tryptophanyl-tRNA synthetase
MLSPVRERYRELRADEQGLERTLAMGAERARSIAQETMAEVRPLMGIGPAPSGIRPAV